MSTVRPALLPTAETLVGQLATEHPVSTRVFARHGIDFCCGGGRPLGEACRARGLDTARVLDELKAALAEAPADAESAWLTAPLSDLIEHILRTYHVPLKEELPRIEAMARKVHQVHGEKDPERLLGVLQVFLGLKAELDPHLLKEEQILFPMIRAGHGAMADGPIHVMEAEHESAGEALAQLRRLTDGYRVPAGACNTWRALWHALEALERDLHAHISLENNVLHPRALRR